MIRRFIFLVFLIPAMFSTNLFAKDEAPLDHKITTEKDLQWTEAGGYMPKGTRIVAIQGDSKKPGIFVMRLEFPGGTEIQPHFHPADEYVTVLKGNFYFGTGSTFDKKKTTAMPAGTFLWLKKGTHHFAWTKGKSVIQIQAQGPWGATFVKPATSAK